VQEVAMTKLFDLFAHRLLRMGGAKASTLGQDGNVPEDEAILYFES
jgi:hypothetical protein